MLVLIVTEQAVLWRELIVPVIPGLLVHINEGDTDFTRGYAKNRGKPLKDLELSASSRLVIVLIEQREGRADH